MRHSVVIENEPYMSTDWFFGALHPEISWLAKDNGVRLLQITGLFDLWASVSLQSDLPPPPKTCQKRVIVLNWWKALLALTFQIASGRGLTIFTFPKCLDYFSGVLLVLGLKGKTWKAKHLVLRLLSLLLLRSPFDYTDMSSTKQLVIRCSVSRYVIFMLQAMYNSRKHTSVWRTTHFL